jgi:hypothetical protein
MQIRSALTFLKMAGMLCSTATAHADTCDYRPSRILGDTVSNAVVGGGIAASTATGAASALGVYTLVNAGSGLTMLGSTLAGASGAGTIGIIAGTGGAIGTAGAIILIRLPRRALEAHQDDKPDREHLRNRPSLHGQNQNCKLSKEIIQKLAAERQKNSKLIK